MSHRVQRVKTLYTLYIEVFRKFDIDEASTDALLDLKDQINETIDAMNHEEVFAVKQHFQELPEDDRPEATVFDFEHPLLVTSVRKHLANVH